MSAFRSRGSGILLRQQDSENRCETLLCSRPDIHGIPFRAYYNLDSRAAGVMVSPGIVGL